ncbi:GDSL-type esterase/lipase family protein [Mucilaginibacter pocheonensis]|uniref:Lysophospholipase L1-like esterase/pimeloyl-ACP methyl ester carboxylesterase n=1 Tax=Mucilaginibacter pocheonensis TaxID=398050 RepID=A0ABU1TDM5_9SPHI|nr:GDSL-type esterase/lipase family protein [Mucilaginibacter pocheonensis]MDR6942960.1 lysophospholipase L1-like esterase/pimeloyl-ACP methyl ester carboxylesterase [Mucilaginibacter pocheonensis]
MKKTLSIVVFIQACIWLSPGFAQSKIKIACIGNSITYGRGVANRETDAYPAQLQALLGNNYTVMNYGVSGTTLLRKGNAPYWQTQQYQNALNSQPDIVFIKLGTNDSKLINRAHLNDFVDEYKDFVCSFTRLSSKPRVILLLPVPSFKKDTAQIWDQVIVRKIIPAIQQVAYDMNIEVIDLHSLLIDKPQFIPDQVHPDKTGLSVIANRLAELVKQKRDTVYDIFSKIDSAKKITSFYGYQCADFQYNGRNCKIVNPKWSDKKHSWIWRARFWGTEPQVEIALLERGYHVVYCDVAELFGNAKAIGLWNNYYSLLRKAGLSKKAVLEGMSRGGVYVYNWAAENPRKVAFVYADNPVLDLKSWPGGKGKGPGSPANWETLKKDYQITSEENSSSFANSPMDKIKKIVKGKYPMLHVCGDADETVPMDENTLPFEQKVKALGGNIIVIHKPNAHHHPHSLPNPTPIVDLILKLKK